MKRFLLTIFLLISTSVFPQQASDYFPSATGYLWNYQVTPLDSLNNPLTNLTFFRQDSFALVQSYQGRTANIVLSKEGPLQTILLQSYTDSIFYSFQGTDGYEYFSVSGIETFLNQLDSLGLDPNFNFLNFFRSLQDWYSVYRFAANTGTRYTLLQKDTLISTYNIRFKYSAVRNNDQTINTVLGTFDCKKFTTQWEFSYLLGPIPIPLFSIEDTNWIAPGNWLVKAYQPSKGVDLSLLGIPPFYIPGRTIDVIDQIVGVDDESLVVNEFKLYQNYPNPFNPSTKISWQSPVGAHQTLKVYDVLGNEIVTLVNEYRDAGRYEVEFPNVETRHASSLPSGVYFYKLQVGNFVETKKMILIK
ncbi:T9SS type A sorting domain-containing protein [Ignavibacterium sp.]|uniref:T9SS type A sorting domain-containing protein n=1 Tax=Ignavibacterium sp. TaxID=2651167 RepID=UPI00220703DA|nr:T9SS type A sorting domain-containing protein [Ignavibacterium sp.]BDQ02490.1 MAG: hypothetical protein KatS3mg037_1065 [Ignavibacterium sp.]